MDNLCDIQQLVALLNPKKNENQLSDEDELDDDEVNGKNSSNLAPNQLNAKAKARPYDRVQEDVKKEVVDPDDDNQFYTPEDVALSDWRKCPQWDLTYRQQVTPSDVFLQVSTALTKRSLLIFLMRFYFIRWVVKHQLRPVAKI